MKYDILRKLKENAPGYVSGEALSKSFGISRTAIWKYVGELRKEGYIVESSTKKGYRVSSRGEVLNSFELGQDLKTKVLGRNIVYFPELDSTNSYAKKIASEGCVDGTAVIADRQTSGRGRLGRKWESAAGSGIYMSVVLRPHFLMPGVQIMTIAASVAAVNAIKEVTGIEAGIKWPNDVLLNGRKVCGILTETELEMDRIYFLVIGIGINVNQSDEDFPPFLRDTAISLKMYAESGKVRRSMKGPGEYGFSRSAIVKRLLFALEQMYDRINKGFTKDILEEWKKYSVTMGKKVRFEMRDAAFVGTAWDITDDGGLVVRCDDGIERRVLSGEVNILRDDGCKDGK